jgi:hypothetical protein
MGFGIISCKRAQKEKELRETAENNFSAYSDSLTVRKMKDDSLNRTILERDILILSNRQLLNSQATVIKDLKNNLNQSDIKIKNVEHLYNVELEINKELRSRVYTEVITDKDPTTSDYIIERDTARIATLTIIRAKYSNEDSARYTVTYNPTLYITKSSYKEGKWRFINIFKWREKKDKVSINSKDNILVPKEIIYIEKPE